MTGSNFKAVLEELGALCRETSLRVYEIAKRVHLLWEDAEFIKECGGSYAGRTKTLSEYCACTGFDAITLCEMFEAAPDSADERWVTGRLDRLREDACREAVRQQRATDIPQPQRKTPAIIPVVQKQSIPARAEVEFRVTAARELDRLKEENYRLTEENIRLKRQNALLTSQLARARGAISSSSMAGVG